MATLEDVQAAFNASDDKPVVKPVAVSCSSPRYCVALDGAAGAFILGGG